MRVIPSTKKTTAGTSGWTSSSRVIELVASRSTAGAFSRSVGQIAFVTCPITTRATIGTR